MMRTRKKKANGHAVPMKQIPSFILSAFLSVACAAAPFRIEAEKGEMLPDAKGGKAGPYDKIAGTSGGSILAFFSRGRGVRYGKTPVAAKWVAVCFGTNNVDADFGRLEYAVEAIDACGLTPDDIWFPSMSIRSSRPTVIYNHFR